MTRFIFSVKMCQKIVIFCLNRNKIYKTPILTREYKKRVIFCTELNYISNNDNNNWCTLYKKWHVSFFQLNCAKNVSFFVQSAPINVIILLIQSSFVQKMTRFSISKKCLGKPCPNLMGLHGISKGKICVCGAVSYWHTKSSITNQCPSDWLSFKS